MSKLIRFYLEDESKGESKTIVNDNSIIFQYPCSSTTDCSPYHLTLSPAKYRVELWGAQGGSDGNNVGGKGGYASGSLNIYKQTHVYLYIGGKHDFISSSLIQEGGYNGGGNGLNNHTDKLYHGCGGGGATDLRLSEDNLYRRIIIAGGGGGCGMNSENTAGCGGGENGCNGHVTAETSAQKCIIEGGSQNYGGRANEFDELSVVNKSYWNYDVAHFGYGCSFHYEDGSGWSSGGGGGGYFGGACGCVYGGGGAGGSGFVYSEEYPQHSTMSISLRYLLSEPVLEDGTSANGNSGNGKATITIQSEFPDPYVITCHVDEERSVFIETVIFVFSS